MKTQTNGVGRAKVIGSRVARTTKNRRGCGQRPLALEGAFGSTRGAGTPRRACAQLTSPNMALIPQYIGTCHTRRLVRQQALFFYVAPGSSFRHSTPRNSARLRLPSGSSMPPFASTSSASFTNACARSGPSVRTVRQMVARGPGAVSPSWAAMAAAMLVIGCAFDIPLWGVATTRDLNVIGNDLLHTLLVYTRCRTCGASCRMHVRMPFSCTGVYLHVARPLCCLRCGRT